MSGPFTERPSLSSVEYSPDDGVDVIKARGDKRYETLEETLDSLRLATALQRKTLAVTNTAQLELNHRVPSQDQPLENTLSNLKRATSTQIQELSEGSIKDVSQWLREPPATEADKATSSRPSEAAADQLVSRMWHLEQRCTDLREDTSHQLEELSLRLSKLEQASLRRKVDVRPREDERYEDNTTNTELSLRLSKLEQAILMMQAEETPVENTPRLTPRSADQTSEPDTDRGGHVRLSKSLHQVSPDDLKQIGQDYYNFSGSIWDAALFVGIPHMGIGASVSIFIALLANIFIQVVWVLLIQEHFSDPFFSPSDLDGLTAWRSSVAHDHSWAVSQDSSSLAARVCGHDQTLSSAFAQVQTLGIIEDYLVDSEGRFEAEGAAWLSGPLMCILALACWCLSVTRELKSTLNMILALTKIPVTDHTVIISDEDDGSLELQRISRRRQIYGIAVVAGARAYVALLLAAYGCQFIIGIIEMQELLLNAVALEFVLTIDELIYDALAPSRARAMLDKVKPIKIRRWPGCAGINVQEIAMFFILSTCILFLRIYLVGDMIANLEKGWDSMCSGNLNFIYNSDSLGLYWIKAGLPPFVGFHARPGLDQRVQIMEEVIGEQDFALWGSALIEDSWLALKDVSAVPDYVAASKIRTTLLRMDTCSPPYDDMFHEPSSREWPAPEDFTVARNLYHGYRTFVQSISGNRSINSCADLAQYCAFSTNPLLQRLSLVARNWCPIACGCSDPVGGVGLVAPMLGCPAACVAKLGEEAMAQQSCAADSSIAAEGVLLNWVQEFAMHSSGNFNDGHLQLLRNTSCASLTPSSAFCYDPSERGTETYKTLLMLCPEACGCLQFSPALRPASCPSSCYQCVNYLGIDISEDLVGECRWSDTVQDPWYEDSFLNVTLVAQNIDGVCCRLLQMYANHTFLNVPEDGGHPTEPDADFMMTLCTPCRRTSCVRSIAQANVTITRASTGLAPQFNFTGYVGSCSVEGMCIQSDNYPLDYSPNGYCLLELYSSQNTTLYVESFSTETGFDYLRIDDNWYGTGISTLLEPGDAIAVGTEGQFEWWADYAAEDEGWRICASPMPPWSGELWSIGDFFSAWAGSFPKMFAGSYMPDGTFPSADEFVESRCRDWDATVPIGHSD